MVVDSMDDGVIVLDAQRRLVDLNAAAERYTGCTNASLGRPIDEVVAWWNEAVAEDRPLGEGQPAVVKVEPGPRYFEVKASRRAAGDVGERSGDAIPRLVPARRVDPLDQVEQRTDPRAIDVVVEPGHIEQDAFAQAGGTRAHHVDVIQIADVHGPGSVGA